MNKQVPPKIFDCFTFYNELDLLEIRLEELHTIIHKFVLVEALFTHQGGVKPYYFEENKSRFEKYKDQIIHIKIDAIPNEYYLLEDKSWFLENYQRRQISLGLSSAQTHDRILISDVDEIPRLKDLLNAATLQDSKCIVFGLRHFAYFLNGEILKKNLFKYYFLSLFLTNYKTKYLSRKYWQGPILVFFDRNFDAQFYRDNRTNDKLVDILLPNCGWHFSYLGGVDKIIEKLNVLNEEFDYEPFKDKSDILLKLTNGKDLFDPNGTFHRIAIDDSFPDAVRKKLQNYQHLM